MTNPISICLEKVPVGHGGIYMIINPNNKKYIGQSVNLHKRLADYKKPSRSKTKRSAIYKSIKKHGLENHVFRILLFGNYKKEHLDVFEKHFINSFNTFKNGLNLTLGGDKGTFGYRHSDDSKRKMSKSKSGKMGSSHYLSKKIYQYSLDGYLIKEWECISYAEEEIFGIKNGVLSTLLKNDKNGTRGGFRWSHRKVKKLPDIRLTQLNKKKPNFKTRKKIYLYSIKNGTLMHEYESITECANALGVSRATIRRVANNFSFSLLKKYLVSTRKIKKAIYKPRKNYNAKTVNLFDKNGSLIRKFDTVKDFALYFGIKTNKYYDIKYGNSSDDRFSVNSDGSTTLEDPSTNRARNRGKK